MMSKFTLEERIMQEIGNINRDERMSYPDANVQVNAPLALIQVSLKARRDALQWVLNEMLKDQKELKEQL